LLRNPARRLLESCAARTGGDRDEGLEAG
jgi:hypothetical protein